MSAIKSEGEWFVQIKEDVQAASSVALDFSTGTLEEAFTTAVSVAAGELSQGFQVAIDSANVNSATGDALINLAQQAGVEKRAATASRYTVRTVDGPATLLGGEIVQGGGLTGRQQWRVITTGVVAAGASVVIESVDTGVVTLTGTVSLAMVTTTPGLTQLTWVSGTDPAGQIGRAAETEAELRARVLLGGNGLVTQVRNLDWVVAAMVLTPSAGTMAITVAPAPVGADQIAELVDTIGPWTIGILTTGSASGIYAQADGTDITVYYSVGTTESVDVAMTVTGSTDGVEAAIRAAFVGLAQGDTVIRQRVIAKALTVSTVMDVTACTLDGSAANYTPALTSIAVPGTVTVS